MFTAIAHKNVEAAKGYFSEHLSQNDYYSAAEVKPGRWIGTGAERLGLGDLVTREGADLEEVIADINALVGMDAIKAQLDQIIALGRIIKHRRDANLKTNNISMHMVFMGPPGTGKTEVARKIGGLLKAIGLLKNGDLHEVDKSKLVGGYQGQTPIKVRNLFEAAIGGVLFIDEAYTLSGGTNEMAGPDAYGDEAITTLLKLMEDYRDRIVVIAAGYTDEMERFLKTNPGLNSRFAKKQKCSSICRALMHNCAK